MHRFVGSTRLLRAAVVFALSLATPGSALAWSFEPWEDLHEPLDAVEVDVPPPSDPSTTAWSQHSQVELALCPSGYLYQFRSTRIGLFGEWRGAFGGQSEFVWVTIERRRIDAPVIDPSLPTTLSGAEAARAAGSTWTVAAKNAAGFDMLVTEASCARGADGADVLLWRGDRGDIGTVAVYDTSGGFAVVPGPSRWVVPAIPAGGVLPPAQLVVRGFDWMGGATLAGFTPRTGVAGTLFFSGASISPVGSTFSALGASFLAATAEESGTTYVASYASTFAMGRGVGDAAPTLTLENPRSPAIAAQTALLSGRASGLDVQRTTTGLWVVLRTRAPGAALYRTRIAP